MIYARQINPDFTLPEHYLEDIFYGEEDNELMIDGGRDWKSFNDDLLVQIHKAIDNYYELEYHYVFDTITDYVNWYLPKKVNGKKYTPLELSRIRDLLEKDNKDSVLGILSIIQGKEYDIYPLRGCCQGDYVELYAPKGMNHEYISYIESVYFNTGIEIMIHDNGDAPRTPEKVDGYCFYTDKWRTEDIIEVIQDTVGSKEKVKLWLFDGYTRTERFKVAE